MLFITFPYFSSKWIYNLGFSCWFCSLAYLVFMNSARNTVVCAFTWSLNYSPRLSKLFVNSRIYKADIFCELFGLASRDKPTAISTLNSAWLSLMRRWFASRLPFLRHDQISKMKWSIIILSKRFSIY